MRRGFIAKTLDSMVAQTLLPERWVIVDDGSTDHTAEIVESYARRYPWIELIRRQPLPTAVLPARFTRLTQVWSASNRFRLK